MTDDEENMIDVINDHEDDDEIFQTERLKPLLYSKYVFLINIIYIEK